MPPKVNSLSDQSHIGLFKCKAKTNNAKCNVANTHTRYEWPTFKVRFFFFFFNQGALKF